MRCDRFARVLRNRESSQSRGQITIHHNLNTNWRPHTTTPKNEGSVNVYGQCFLNKVNIKTGASKLTDRLWLWQQLKLKNPCVLVSTLLRWFFARSSLSFAHRNTSTYSDSKFNEPEPPRYASISTPESWLKGTMPNKKPALAKGCPSSGKHACCRVCKRLYMHMCVSVNSGGIYAIFLNRQSHPKGQRGSLCWSVTWSILFDKFFLGSFGSFVPCC